MVKHEILTLSLHDALPISRLRRGRCGACKRIDIAGSRAIGRFDANLRTRLGNARDRDARGVRGDPRARSEEHTSELQSRVGFVWRLLLEKKKRKMRTNVLS